LYRLQQLQRTGEPLLKGKALQAAVSKVEGAAMQAEEGVSADGIRKENRGR
jgi:hypothetical protein